MYEVLTDSLPDEDVVDAKAILQRANIQPGMTVADLGCGRQALYTIAAAQMVTQTGVVYACDVVKEVLPIISEKVEAAGFHNVLTVWTDLEIFGATKKILDGTVDVDVLTDILFQSSKKKEMIEESIRMLKPGGKLLIVDWKPVKTLLGPPVEQRVKLEEMKEICATLKLHLIDEFEAGEYHFGVIFQR